MSTTSGEDKISLKTIFMFNLVWIFKFALIYFIIGQFDNQFNYSKKNLSFLDSIYFSCSIQSTIAFGEISPRTTVAKFFVILHQLSILIGYVGVLSGRFTQSALDDMKGKFASGFSSMSNMMKRNKTDTVPPPTEFQKNLATQMQ